MTSATMKARGRRAPGRPLKSPLAAPAAWTGLDPRAGSDRHREAEVLSDRQATIAEFDDYLRTVTVTNRDKRPDQEATINAYVSPAKNLDAWMTAKAGNRGMSLEAIAAMHRSLDMTLRYANYRELHQMGENLQVA